MKNGRYTTRAIRKGIPQVKRENIPNVTTIVGHRPGNPEGGSGKKRISGYLLGSLGGKNNVAIVLVEYLCTVDVLDRGTYFPSTSADP
jgi:hypothetical protein